MSNSVELVRQAEKKAEEVVAAANNESNQIISDAKKAAEKTIGDGENASRLRFADSVEAAHKTNRDLMDEFNVELDAEIQSLKDTTRHKTAGAAQLVYKHLASAE